MGQGLESSPYPTRTTAGAGRPVIIALTAHNWCAHGGLLTAGCPHFWLSPLTTVRDDRPIRRSPKCGQPSLAPLSHRLPARLRLRLTASGPPCAKLATNGFCQPANLPVYGSLPDTTAAVGGELVPRKIGECRQIVSAQGGHPGAHRKTRNRDGPSSGELTLMPYYRTLNRANEKRESSLLGSIPSRLVFSFSTRRMIMGWFCSLVGLIVIAMAISGIWLVISIAYLGEWLLAFGVLMTVAIGLVLVVHGANRVL